MLCFHETRVQGSPMSLSHIGKDIFVHEVGHLLQQMVGDFPKDDQPPESVEAYLSATHEVDAYANQTLTDIDERLRKRKHVDPEFVLKVFGNDEKGLARFAKRSMGSLWGKMRPESQKRYTDHLRNTRDMYVGQMQNNRKPNFRNLPEQEEPQVQPPAEPAAAAPVVSTRDKNHALGTVVMLRELDEKATERLAAQVRLPVSLVKCARNCRTRSGMSSVRSRSGGTAIGNTCRR